MKRFLIFFIVCLAMNSFAQSKYGLTEEDQKFFKNDNFEGKNKLERIDANVREINKIYGELEKMKQEISSLKSEIKQLRSSQNEKK
jgi:hypothetical protein